MYADWLLLSTREIAKKEDLPPVARDAGLPVQTMKPGTGSSGNQPLRISELATVASALRR
ncbi:hypothetical protein EL18_02530 [Nitratireductor basaltis]|uniref:Uncharacterized protein n=1 Tax=Nitratireductor basaltis TaxID=472175 RepID=A0A084U5P5_9HYPH|nr:hypothetical protein EL18_02530 [Nitratireductor basaltis]